MARLESICRVLRDLGIFLLGVAAISVAIDYLFIRPDPMRDMQKVITKSFTDDLEKSLKQTNTSSRDNSDNEIPSPHSNKK